jgi:hypothetical protein
MWTITRVPYSATQQDTCNKDNLGLALAQITSPVRLLGLYLSAQASSKNSFHITIRLGKEYGTNQDIF